MSRVEGSPSAYSSSGMTDRAQLEAAIAAQEQLRSTLGDAIVDATIGALRSQLHALEPETAIEHQRRLVTVLFMDVVDSTRILVGVDPEETLAIMDAALERLAEPVRARGGRVTRFMGDGFLAVFGLRRTRENDAEMAVQAGLDIVESAGIVAEDVARHYGVLGFDVRVGINTGLVVTGGVTEAQDTIMGSAVNLASRIESAAPPGGVLISQSTFRQVRGRFESEPVGTIDAKGFAEPVPVHLVKGERSEMSMDGHSGTDHVDVELIGRRDELAVLGGALDEVVATGRARTITIVGEAGIGKSRLLAEFEARLPSTPPVTVFRARGSQEGSDVPNSLLRDLLDRRFGIRTDDSVSVVHEKLQAGLGAELTTGTAQAAGIHLIGRLLGYDMTGHEAPPGFPDTPQALRDRAVVQLIEFFRAAAASSTVLLVFDDLQWADASSLAILAELIEELSQRPVLTLALSRPSLHENDPEWFARVSQGVLSLSPLSAEDAGLLVDSMLRRVDDCPPQLRTMLLERAGGNPYYLEELVLMCIDEGVILIDGATWSVRVEHLDSLDLPTTLTGVIRARLDGLPEEERTALQQASVVGRVFWDEAVARIAGTSNAQAIEPQLDSLQSRQMIHPRHPSTFGHSAEYGFSHTLLRDATYEAVLLGARRTYHGVVADWLIARSGDREQELVAVIAGHLERAGRSAEAIDYLTRAATAAWDSYAIASAAEFFDRALALTPVDDFDRRYELLLGRAKASALQGDRDQQRRVLDDLGTVARWLADPAKSTAVAIERTYLGFYTGDYRAALASAERAVAFAATTDDLDLQSRTQSSVAWAHLYLGDWLQARAAGEQALSLARRAGQPRSEAAALNLLGMLSLSEGDLSDSRSRLNRAIELADLQRDRDRALTYRNNLAVALTMIGDYSAAEQHFDDNLHFAEEGGDRISVSSAHINLAWVAASRGDWEVARVHAERGIALKRRQEHIEAVAEGLLWLGHALVGLGRLDEAAIAYDESLNIRLDLNQTALALGVRAGLARLAISRGDTKGAAAHARAILQHIEQGETLDGTWEPLRIHLSAFEALRAAGDEAADGVLLGAHDLLRERSARIPDPDDRRLFLEAVPWHRRILELVDAMKA